MNTICKEDRVIDFIRNKRFLDTNPYGEEYEEEDTFEYVDYHRPMFEC